MITVDELLKNLIKNGNNIYIQIIDEKGDIHSAKVENISYIGDEGSLLLSNKHVISIDNIE
jgi:hypothetical protein